MKSYERFLASIPTSFAPIPVVTSRYVPRGRAFVVNTGSGGSGVMIFMHRRVLPATRYTIATQRRRRHR